MYSCNYLQIKVNDLYHKFHNKNYDSKLYKNALSFCNLICFAHESFFQRLISFVIFKNNYFEDGIYNYKYRNLF